MPNVGSTPVLEALLLGLLSKHGGRQIFVFGSEGEPFRAARLPVERAELDLLRRALDLIERLEEQSKKPFLEYDERNQLVVAALEEVDDLYFVVLLEPVGSPAEVGSPVPAQTATAVARRVEMVRAELRPHAALLCAALRRHSA